jgi:hypothetical protein
VLLHIQEASILLLVLPYEFEPIGISLLDNLGSPIRLLRALKDGQTSVVHLLFNIFLGHFHLLRRFRGLIDPEVLFVGSQLEELIEI